MTTVRMQLNGTSEHFARIRENVQPKLEEQLAAPSLALRAGAPVFIRIFKESKELEVWLQEKGSGDKAQRKYVLFKTYPIASYGSGTLAPKLAEGDGQAPTGIYTVSKAQLKPDSDYHLAFNLGFPNAYDQNKGRTGSFLMVHGSTASIGCYAMTDPLIEEIYLLVDAALSAGQKAVPVHAFPFRMSEARMRKAAESEGEKAWLEEWKNLKNGHDRFEESHIPPRVKVGENGFYVFE